MSTFTGKFYVPSDEGFVEAAFSRVFNHRRPTDRLPSAVLVAENEQDVVAGVRFAKENGLAVAVRSGGHSWAVWSVQNNTLLIDLGNLNSAEYDETTGIVSGGPAIEGGNVLDPFLAERGRFFNGGHCPPVGIGGFLLQGGCCKRSGRSFLGRFFLNIQHLESSTGAFIQKGTHIGFGSKMLRNFRFDAILPFHEESIHAEKRFCMKLLDLFFSFYDQANGNGLHTPG